MAEQAGIRRDAIAIDPGFGFAKHPPHSLALLRDLARLTTLGLPIVAGVSRKGFIGSTSGEPEPARRFSGSSPRACSRWRGGRRCCGCMTCGKRRRPSGCGTRWLARRTDVDNASAFRAISSGTEPRSPAVTLRAERSNPRILSDVKSNFNNLGSRWAPGTQRGYTIPTGHGEVHRGNRTAPDNRSGRGERRTPAYVQSGRVVADESRGRCRCTG